MEKIICILQSWRNICNLVHMQCKEFKYKGNVNKMYDTTDFSKHQFHWHTTIHNMLIDEWFIWNIIIVYEITCKFNNIDKMNVCKK